MLLLLFDIDGYGSNSVFPQHCIMRHEECVKDHPSHMQNWPVGFKKEKKKFIDFWLPFLKLSFS